MVDRFIGYYFIFLLIDWLAFLVFFASLAVLIAPLPRDFTANSPQFVCLALLTASLPHYLTASSPQFYVQAHQLTSPLTRLDSE